MTTPPCVQDGYKLKGSDRTECQFGTWSGQTPVCEAGQPRDT